MEGMTGMEFLEWNGMEWIDGMEWNGDLKTGDRPGSDRQLTRLGGHDPRGTPSRGSPRPVAPPDAVAWCAHDGQGGDLPVLDVVTEALRSVARPRSRRG